MINKRTIKKILENNTIEEIESPASFEIDIVEGQQILRVFDIENIDSEDINRFIAKAKDAKINVSKFCVSSSNVLDITVSFWINEF